MQHGDTWYRGSWRTAESLGVVPAGPAPTPSAMRSCRSTMGRQPRLKVVTYNIGGMTAELYDILLAWLHHDCRAQVVILVETHWGLGRQDGCWTVGTSLQRQTRPSATLVSASVLPTQLQPPRRS